MAVAVATLGERALRRLGVTVVPAAARPALSVIIPAATLATRALVALGVIAADETPSTLDAALAIAKVSAVHDGLVGQAFVSWSLDAVPQAVSEDYVMLTAMHLAGSFGKVVDPAHQPVLEARIRKIGMVMGALDIATGAIMTVHLNLNARGLTRWTVFDIPPAAEDIYVVLAAAALAPELPGFGPPPPASDVPRAERSLAQIIALPSSGERVMAEYF